MEEVEERCLPRRPYEGLREGVKERIRGGLAQVIEIEEGI